MSELPPAMLRPASAPPSLSADMRALILFEANRKDLLVGYLLAFFLGLLGGHNFYLGRTGVAIAQLILTITIIGLLVTMIWVLVDCFLLPGWVREQNNRLAGQLGA